MMPEIPATSMQVVATPFSCYVHTNARRLNKYQKANRNSLLAPHMKGFLFGAHYSGRIRTGDQRQSHNIICFKNVWVDKMAGF